MPDLDVTTRTPLAAGAIAPDTMRVMLLNPSQTGDSRFQVATVSILTALGSATLHAGTTSGWASHLASNPPTVAGQQILLLNAGNFAHYVAATATTWQFAQGRRLGTSSPLSSVTPLGVGEIYVVQSLDGYGTVDVAGSAVWIAVGPNATHWRQAA